MSDPVEVDQSIRIEAPAARVWRALTELDDLRRWMFPSMRVDVRPGGTWEFTFPHWPSARGLVHPALGMGGPILEIEPGRLLAVQFREPYWGVLRFALADGGSSSTLRVTHDGFAGNEDWEGDFRGGWGSFTDRLAVLCETGEVPTVAPGATALRLPLRVAFDVAVASLARSLPRRGWVADGEPRVDGGTLVLPCRPGVDRADPEPFVRAFERAFCAPGRALAASYFAPGGALWLAGGPYPRPLATPLGRLPSEAVARFRALTWQGVTLCADWNGSGWTAARNEGTSEWTFADCGRIERLVLRAQRRTRQRSPTSGAA